MRATLPGRPQTKLQAVSTGLWDDHRIITYISGSAVILLDGPNNVLQTIYTDESDDELVAVAFDEPTGKVAAASSKSVYVYQPYGQQVGAVRWSLQHTLTLQDANDNITTLSWGLDEELLIGSASLTLFTTHGESEQQWMKPLAAPAKYALFSPDAAFIATTGGYNRLAKLCHRLTYSGEQRFQYAYLPHPATVTGLKWRQPWYKEQNTENVLYTICADHKVRIWAPQSDRPGSGHGLDTGEMIRLWATIDLMESIQPRHLAAKEERSRKRYACIIDGRDFSVATERAIAVAGDNPPDEEKHALDHLVEVANRSPEIVIALDERGNMSAWGLESVGCKTRKTSDVFNVAHVEGLQLGFAQEQGGLEDMVNFCTFGSRDGNGFTLLTHHFDGRLLWFESRMDQLFDPVRRQRRLSLKASLTGHSRAIKKAIRTASGKALISRTEDGEAIVWAQRRNENELSLARHSRLKTAEHIHRTWILEEGDFIVFLHHKSISLWDARHSKAVEVARCQYTVKGKPLCLILVPEIEANQGLVHLATISSEMKGVAWEVRLPPKRSNSVVNGHLNGNTGPNIAEFSQFDLGSGDDLAYVLPVDPAGTAPVISGFLDTFARDIAISYTHSGQLKSWTARVDLESRKLDWLETSTIETGINHPSLASATSIRKAALIDSDKTTLSIWNVRSEQLEYEEKFETAIQDLDWSSTPDNQSVLAVGFAHKVIIYTQLRYDYLDAGPSWAAIREVDIREYTSYVIGDSVWMSCGHLVIGAGNQLFLQDDQVSASTAIVSDLRLAPKKDVGLGMFEVVRALNGPLPVYHPQFVSQCILAGKLPLVHRILVTLYKKLKFFSEGDELDSFLGLTVDDFSKDQTVFLHNSKKEMQSSYADFTDDDEPEMITEEVATSLNELLSQRTVPALSSREQFRLADIVEIVGTSEKHRRSLDENGSRFLLFFRQHVLLSNQKVETSSPISWREITWAYHSGSQDILIDLVSRHWNGKMLWKQARESGMFMWMSDLTALKTQFETIGRNEYTKTDEKNPVDCSLFYFALKKKAVLVGLWRMATWNREQAGTQRLLANNFNDPRWKTAALKNAYALMSKRRFEYAAAFFLLADHLKDAVNVLANQTQDLQLAIAVARVYEGDNGPILREFLEETVLPQAVQEGNRWLATWAFWLLNKKDKAVIALVSPLESLITPPASPNPQSKLFLSDDPALVVLYKQLRERSLQTLKGALSVHPRAEWEFVTHTARLYARMGCDILALDLVRTWEFLLKSPATSMSIAPLPSSLPTHSALQSPRITTHTPSMLDNYDIDPRKLLRRRSSLVVADLPTREAIKAAANGDKVAQEAKKEEKKKKPPPTQFKEPDANSLLDAFGF